jgi:hypothetical protein
MIVHITQKKLDAGRIKGCLRPPSVQPGCFSHHLIRAAQEYEWKEQH